VIIQRAVEGSGIPTIIISALPDISVRCGAPRGVSPIVPIGANAGAPHHPLQQREILRAALLSLAAIRNPGENVPLAIEY
jgi:D-proline reductase (dithiol) PrdB